MEEFAKENNVFIEVSGAGLPEVDGLYVPSSAPAQKSESGTMSSPGYWNGKMAWDRADGKSERSPAISYSNSYRSWRICRLDGHLAYDMTCEDELPPADREWHVYKKGVAPAPKVAVHHFDPRLPCPDPNVVFVLGGPGAGKGTMCELAELQLGWKHLSIGELVRSEMDAGGPSSREIAATLADGQLVSNEIVLGLLKRAMEATMRETGNQNFLLDGFPRSLHNLDGWYETFGTESEIPKMLFFECPYDVLEARILGRAKYTGRNDDNVASLKKRFDTFKEETLPIVEHFESLGKCIRLNTGLDRKVVYETVESHLSEFTDREKSDLPLSERVEMLLGLRPFPKEKI